MASTNDYHYMKTSLRQSHCHDCLVDKHSGDLLPKDLEFSSAMNLDNSNEFTQNERQCNHHQQHPHMYQQQHQQRPQLQKLPAISHVARNPSFRLPSIPSLIFESPSHSVPRRRYSASSSPADPYPNPTQRSVYLPSLDHLANRSPSMPTQSLPSISPAEHPLEQAMPSAVGVSTRPGGSSFLVSMTDDNNRASYVIHPLPVLPTTPGTILTTSAVNASHTPVLVKKGRQTKKPKFISRILDSNMQRPSGNSKDSNDSTSFRPYQYEHRQSSRPYQQQQQEGRRRRISSVGTASSLTSAHVSSSTTTIGSSLSSSTAPSVVSTSSATMVKPRWQGTERLDLLKAIVKEKQLDDMTSFSWDRISVVVGRGKKSCKDQWRREILPALLERLK